MDGSAVKEIAALKDADAKYVQIDGLPWTDKPLTPVIFDPRPEPLKFVSLSALVEYITSQVEYRNPQHDGSETFIIVDSVDQVSFVQQYSGLERKRTVFAIAKPITTDVFPFGEWLDLETAVINAKTFFLPSPDLNEIIQTLSTVSKDTGVDSKDDGVTQQVNVRVGIKGGLTEKKEQKGIYSLQARRIFPEVIQPTSEFIFRLRASEPVTAAIFEADGGAWKLQALANIKTWLADKLPNVPILA